MPQIVWTESAIDDLNRHYKFLKIKNTDAAVRAVQEIVSSGESLQENPRRGKIVEEIAGIRKLLVAFGKYGYIIHYAILRMMLLFCASITDEKIDLANINNYYFALTSVSGSAQSDRILMCL